MNYIVVDIGCFECGEASNIVWVFSSQEAADKVAQQCNDKYSFVTDQHSFEVFPMPALDTVHSDYEVILP